MIYGFLDQREAAPAASGSYWSCPAGNENVMVATGIVAVGVREPATEVLSETGIESSFLRIRRGGGSPTTTDSTSERGVAGLLRVRDSRIRSSCSQSARRFAEMADDMPLGAVFVNRWLGALGGRGQNLSTKWEQAKVFATDRK